jgi:AcrR family transcriptional regulator
VEETPRSGGGDPLAFPRGTREDTNAAKRQSPSLTERRMARTRQQLAEVAARLFLKRGYEAVTVEEIVTTVGVSPRTFFRYFSSKEDVLDEILVNEAEAVIEALRERPTDEPILDALRAAAYSWVGATQRDPRTLRLFALVMRTPLLRTRWLVRQRACQETLAQILVERLPEGPAPHILLLAAGAIIAMIATIFESWIDHLDETEVLKLIDEAIQALATGFGLAESAPATRPGTARRVSRPGASSLPASQSGPYHQ